MDNPIPEISDEKSTLAATQAIVAINHSIARLKQNRQLLETTLGLNRGDDVDNVVATIKSEVDHMCSTIPPELNEDDACEWLRHALLDVVHNNT